jgi:phenylalanine-4-hydroxylase
MFHEMLTLEANIELESDHIGFHDQEYRKRRAEIVEKTKSYDHKLRNYPVIEYLPSEIKTWKTVLDKLESLYPKIACGSYLKYFAILKKEQIFQSDRIPDLKKVSDFLESYSGFRLYPVSGLLTSKQFLQGLASKIFYCTQYIRHPSEPFYTPEPDIVHEMLGHVPMFLDPDICEISEIIGKVALQCSENKIKELERIYWFTVEFGIIRNTLGENKIYGAGLLSSFGEIEKIINLQNVQLLPFDIHKIIQDYPLITQMQNNYYVTTQDEKSSEFTNLKEYIRKYLSNYL